MTVIKSFLCACVNGFVLVKTKYMNGERESVHPKNFCTFGYSRTDFLHYKFIAIYR